MLFSRSLKSVIPGLALACAGGLLLAGCDRQSNEKVQAKLAVECSTIPAKVGEPDCGKQGNEMPDFTLVDPSGKKLAMTSLKGKPVLLNLWATWCAPCVAELPQLDKLAGGKLQIDHWREKATAQAQVKAEIIKHLYAHLPPGVYDTDEINTKANAVFAHLYTAGFGEGARVYH